MRLYGDRWPAQKRNEIPHWQPPSSGSKLGLYHREAAATSCASVLAGGELLNSCHLAKVAETLLQAHVVNWMMQQRWRMSEEKLMFSEQKCQKIKIYGGYMLKIILWIKMLFQNNTAFWSLGNISLTCLAIAQIWMLLTVAIERKEIIINLICFNYCMLLVITTVHSRRHIKNCQHISMLWT